MKRIILIAIALTVIYSDNGYARDKGGGPEIIEDASKILGKKRELVARDRMRRAIFARKDELFKDPTSPVGGNPNGDVTVVEFFDYQCGYCKVVFPRIEKLLIDDSNLRFVFKEMPILGPNSVFAARAALAARKQGEKQYVAFHKAMMASRGSLNKASVLRFATGAGLDVERLKGDMEDDNINDMIRRNLKLADALSINGTPAFVIGDTIVRGAVDLQVLKSLVERARNTGFRNQLLKTGWKRELRTVLRNATIEKLAKTAAATDGFIKFLQDYPKHRHQ